MYVSMSILGGLLMVCGFLMWFIYAVFQIMFWSEIATNKTYKKIFIFIVMGFMIALPLTMMYLPFKWCALTFIPFLIQFLYLNKHWSIGYPSHFKKKILIMAIVFWATMMGGNFFENYRKNYVMEAAETTVVTGHQVKNEEVLDWEITDYGGDIGMICQGRKDVQNFYVVLNNGDTIKVDKVKNEQEALELYPIGDTLKIFGKKIVK